MRPITRILGLALLCGVLPATARADGVPNFKKRGDLERQFVEPVCVAIIKAARPSARSPALSRFEYKEPKDGRRELHVKGRFTGLISRNEYSADIVIHLNDRDPRSWEVLRIDYDDDSKNVADFSRKGIDNLEKKFNDDGSAFRKRGELERRFVEPVCVAVIKAARPTARSPGVRSFEYKEPKAGRKELHIKGKFTGLVSRTEYTADIVIHIDARDPRSWEVLRIDYDDDSKSVAEFSRKNLDSLEKRFNGE